MTKTAFTYCMALLCTTFCYAQPNFEVSEPYERINTRVKDYIEFDGRIYSFKFRSEGVYIQCYGSEASSELARELLTLPEGYNFETIAPINGEYYIFYSVFDRKERKENFSYRKVDLRGSRWAGDEKLLLSLDGEVRGYAESNDLTAHRTKFQLLISEAKNFYYFNYTLIIDRDNTKYGYLVFDQDFKETFHYQKNQDDFGEEYFAISTIVTNDGRIISLMDKPDRTNEPKIKWVQGDPLPRLYQIVVLSSKSEEPEISIPEFDYPITSNLKVFETASYGPCILGYYHPRLDESFDGFFINSLEKKKSVTYKASYRELSRLETKYYKAEDRKKVIFKPEDTKYLKVTEIHELKDSTQLIIMEKRYTIIKAGSAANQSQTPYRDDMLVIKADHNGNVVWMRYLPKHQAGKRIPGSMSYSYTFDKDKHYFMYMEHVKNETNWDNKTYHRYSENGSGNLVAFIIDDYTGEINKQIIFDCDQVEEEHLYHVWPTKAVHIHDNEFAIEGYKKKKGDVMVKIVLEN